uniref:RING-H2 finger protein ATL47-like n=2 Tax=Cicer arietinum TaxID=3827 RepID=A0A1S2XJP5_CICAR|nr:RING-H2 finger protein ATL47-like [Cicer arietinum]
MIMKTFAIMQTLTLVYTHLKWILDFLVYHPFYKLHDCHLPIFEEDYNIWNYKRTPGSEEEVDCAVCLCQIKEGDEIRVLRCEHMYHINCLDKWISFKTDTCPLCRESLRPRRDTTELGAEVLLFNFGTFRTDRDCDDWWLR